MKRSFSSRRPLTLTATAALLAAGFLSAPALRAQQPTPEPTATPATHSSSGNDQDIFDVIKKGADKLQKEAKEQKELAPEIKKLNERQNDLLRRHIELERHLQSILLKQEEAIQRLDKAVEKLEKEVAEGKAPEASKPAAPLPMTEPPATPTPTPTPTATPSA